MICKKCKHTLVSIQSNIKNKNNYIHPLLCEIGECNCGNNRNACKDPELDHDSLAIEKYKLDQYLRNRKQELYQLVKNIDNERIVVEVIEDLPQYIDAKGNVTNLAWRGDILIMYIEDYKILSKYKKVTKFESNYIDCNSYI
ncbi:MAG: hypothetical protein QXO60_00070 [Candidatus Micrarchaeia archaeon]